MTRKGRWDDLNEKRRPILDWFLFFLFCALSILVPFFLLFGHDILEINRLKRELNKPSDFHAVAIACKELLEQTPPSKTFSPPDFKDLPEVLRKKHPRNVNIRRFENGDGEVTVEFGGGFEHFGYRLEKVPGSGPQWRLVMYGEIPEDDRELLRL